MSSRIRWDEEEQDKIAAAIAKHLIRYPGTTLPIAYKAVEYILPVSRRRVMASVAQFDKMLPKIRELMNQPVQPKPASIKHEPEFKIVEKFITKTNSISDFTTEELQAEINRRLIEPIIEKMTNTILDSVRSMLKKPETVKVSEPQKPKLKKIMVVGLIGEQRNFIEKEFKDIFDLKFYDKDDNIQSLKERAINCDEIILMTKFISHKHQDLVKASGAPFSYCNGGISDLSKQLEAMFVGS